MYDTSLKFCREGYAVSSSDDRLAYSFFILLWLKHPRSGWIMNSAFENWLQKAFEFHFLLLLKQISEVIFYKQFILTNFFFVVTFRLITLTPFQSLVMANRNKSKLINTRENIAFLVNVVSRQLSCNGKEKSYDTTLTGKI